MKTPQLLYVGPFPHIQPDSQMAWSASLDDLVRLCQKYIGIDPRYIVKESMLIGRVWRPVRHVTLTNLEVQMAANHGAIELTRSGMVNVITAAYNDLPFETQFAELSQDEQAIYDSLTRLF